LFGLHGRRGGSNRCSAALTLCSVAAGRSDFAAVYDCDWITSEVAGYIVRKAGGKMHTSRKHGTIASANRLLCRWAVQAGGKSG
jgi:fructose-1,6-bisphosphatase/inositol monophosphatase family enzyme